MVLNNITQQAGTAETTGKIIGSTSNYLTDKLNGVTTTISNFISGLTIFEWCIILLLAGLIFLYIYLKNVMNNLKHKRIGIRRS